MQPSVIVTPRLRLTPLTGADADVMVDVLGDESLHEFIGGRPATVDELRVRYAALAAGSGDPDQIWLNWIVHDQRPVGTVQATVFRRTGGWVAEIAWVIGVPWQRRGYAAEAAGGLVAWLRARGVRAISANVHPDHRASASVAARAGLTPTDEHVDGERVWRCEPSP